jgi:hypothetical protein
MIKLVLNLVGKRKIDKKFPNVKLIKKTKKIYEVNSNSYDLYIQLCPYSEDNEFIDEDEPEPESYMYRRAA